MKPSLFAASVSRAATLAAVIASMVALPASAEIIANEDFDIYPASALAGNGSTGAGWAGAWVAGPAAGLTTEIKNTSTSGSIGITPSGGQAVAGGKRALDVYPPAGTGSTPVTGIAATRQLAAAQTGTFYAGFVIQWNSGSFNSNDTFALHFTDSAADEANGFNFGYRGQGGTYGVMARKGTGNPIAGANSTFTTNTAVRYLVAKFEKSGSANYNKITVWVNPGTTSETTLPNGDCQLSGVDSGVAAISSINLRVENLLAPDAGSNGNDKVRLDSLALATRFADLMGNARETRPFIWVRAPEKQDILAKISGNSWATSVYNGMVSRVASDVASHQTNRDSFLRQLPVVWTSSPAKFKTIPTYTESSVSGAAEAKFNDGVDCAVLYYLTGDAKYARCAADILHNAVKTMIPMNPSTSVGNGGWIWEDDFLYEARKIGSQLPIIYDFLYPYLQANQVYDVQTAGMVNFSFTNAQNVFRTFYELARDHGSKDSNWSALMSTCMLNSILALDDATERAAALQVYLVTGSSRQASLSYDYQNYQQPGDVWPESLQYARAVGEIRTSHMVMLERFDPNLQLFDTYPNLPTSLSRISYLTYPNGEQISFGDGHRGASGQSFFEYEQVYQHAKARGNTSLTSHFGSLINGGVSTGAYNRNSLQSYSPLGQHNEPLQLLWNVPSIPEPAAPLVLPRADRLPFAGVALQRNLPATNPSRYGMMAFVGGSAHVHSHASGMSMELFGMGQVLGAKSGRLDYDDTITNKYYRVFASNNTVVVNGASRGEGGWKGLGMNTVQTVAMEPQPFQTAISPDVSFTCSSFADDKGTLADATQQRTVSLIRTSPTTGYYVDIFRSDSSKSNEFHDYIYRNVGASVSLDTSTGPLALTSAPNRFQTDIGDSLDQPGWRYFQDTEVSASTSDSVKAQFVASLPAGQTYMDLHIPGAANREYSRVTSPAIVDAPSPYDNLHAPTLVVRRTGEAWNNPFAVVFEPHLGAATSGTVKTVTKLMNSGVLVGLKVESIVGGNNLTQYVLSNPTATATYTDAATGISFTGRFAVITDKGASAGSLYLGDGSSLTYQGRTLASQSGNNTQATVTITPGQAPVITSNAPVNFTDPSLPSISAIADRVTGENTPTAAIPFIVADADTPLDSLTVTATSSNTTVIPNSGIVLGGSGANRAVTLTPAAGEMGTTVITVQVSDGQASANTTFTLTVGGVLISDGTDTNIKDDGSLIDQSSATAYAGSGGNPVVDRCAVFVFELPDLGAVADPFTSTSFVLNYESKVGSVPNIDLHGLGRRDQNTVPGSDYYGQTTTADPTAGTTRLQTNILTNNTPLGQVTTSASGSSALRAYLNSQYASGAGIGKFVFLRLNTTVPKNGANRALMTMSEGSTGPPDIRPQIVYIGNSAPTLSNVADASTLPGTATAALPFTIGDAETAAESLTVTAISSNTTLVPNSNVVLGGSSANRTVTITPAAGISGTSIITLQVNDGARTTTTTFTVTVLPTLFADLADSAPRQIDGQTPSILVSTATDATLYAGRGGAGGSVDRCVVFPFRLPDLGATSTPFTSASLTFDLVSNNFSPTVCNLDLYGLVVRPTPNVQASDYYSETNVSDPTAGTTRLQDNLCTMATTPGLISTSTGGNAALVNFLNAQYAGGANAGKYVFLRLSKDTANGTNTKQYLVTSADGASAVANNTIWPRINYSAAPANVPPTLSDIADQSTAANTGTGAIAFTIGDSQTAATDLTLGKFSSNPALVPDANIVFGGSDANRTVSITPAANQLGSSTISITVSDGSLTTSDTFVVTVTGTASETWRFTHFGTTANSGMAADAFDSNNDGETNLLEFATGQNPNASTLLTTPLIRNGANLEFTYTRGNAAMTDGIQFAVEWSDTFGTWSSDDVTESPPVDNGTTQTIKATFPAGTGGRRFVHLKVTR